MSTVLQLFLLEKATHHLAEDSHLLTESLFYTVRVDPLLRRMIEGQCVHHMTCHLFISIFQALTTIYKAGIQLALC